MKKKITLCMIAQRIEWQWLFIQHGRKKGNRIINGLLAKGLPINPPEVMELNQRLHHRFNKVKALTARYEVLSGNSYPTDNRGTNT